jgi:hypothetical protein
MQCDSWPQPQFSSRAIITLGEDVVAASHISRGLQIRQFEQAFALPGWQRGKTPV